MSTLSIMLFRKHTLKTIEVAIAVLIAGTASLSGQPARPGQQPAWRASTNLTQFDLDFPGGTPVELVDAISAASGSPLNAIIPDEHANVSLPALHMTRVTAPRLFEALRMATAKAVAYPTGLTGYGSGASARTSTQYQSVQTYYSFETAELQIDDATVWYFRSQQPPLLSDESPPQKPKTCRFFQLAPYLEAYKVEDITTAVQTAWKMLGETQPPTLSYHNDTKLLIAVGEPEKVLLIEDVLKHLTHASTEERTPSPQTNLEEDKVRRQAE